MIVVAVNSLDKSSDLNHHFERFMKHIKISLPNKTYQIDVSD